MRLFLAAFFSLMMSSALAGGVSPLWEGEMTQFDASGAKTYPVRLTRLGDSISSEYPTLNCRGNWRLIATHRNYKIYEESIYDGRLMKGQAEGCIDGIVTFYDGWKEAHFSWFASFEGQPTTAWAIVKPAAR